MKHLQWILWMCLAGTSLLHGNGGGYIQREGMNRGGSIVGFEPESVEKVRIMNENLTAEIGPSSTDVEVIYLMRNLTGEKAKVKFGFPVEECSLIFWDSTTPRSSAGTSESGTPEFLSNYQVTAAGQAVAAKWQRLAERPKNDERYKDLAGWLVSEVKFAANEEKVLTIRYTVTHDADDFVYRLSTGACWGGTIAAGKVTIRPVGVDPRNVLPARPINRFKRVGDDWVWEFENLEPTLDDDLKIESNHADETISDDANPENYRRYGRQWTMEERKFKVTASSTLPPENRESYEASKLNDRGDGVWAEGNPGPGVGEWLEIRPQRVKPLRSIPIRPGYAQSENLFKANARPRKVKVILNGGHSFKADIPDRNAPFVIPVRNFDAPVEKIRLVFEDVWPGKNFEDLCVSRLGLELRLDKKPKINPYR